MDEELRDLLVEMTEISKLKEDECFFPELGISRKKGILTSLIRMIKRESRENTIEHIKKVVTKCSKAIERYGKTEFYTDIIDTVIEMYKGIMNSLMITYSSDIHFTSVIKVQLKQLEHFVPDERKPELPISK